MPVSLMRCVSTMRLAIPMFYQVFLRSLETIIGTHENAVRCIEFSSETNAIITGSWDSTIKLWDPRAVRCMGTYAQPDKVIVDLGKCVRVPTILYYYSVLVSFQVFTMSLCGERLVVGTAGRRVYIWDLRNMGYVQKRESSLKFQTRCIRCFPNKQVCICQSLIVDYFNIDDDCMVIVLFVNRDTF